MALSDVAPLLMHAAVIERDGFAAMLPAPAGAGKSTLCAALVCSGWRLFSDETAIFTDDGLGLAPNPRPISLKNRAIEIIRHRFPDAFIGKLITGTPKGDVAYLRAPRDAVARCRETAPAALVIRPAYRASAPLSIKRLGNVEAFQLLTGNAVNYASMLRFGFDAMVALVERCGCYELAYSDLDEAIDAVDRLHRQHAGH
jgi:HprK-related kinase A